MGRAYRFLDFVLDWWERYEWVGAPGASMLNAYAFYLWAWASGQPPVIIAFIAFTVFAVSLILFLCVPEQLRKLYSRPFAVWVPTVATFGGKLEHNVVVQVFIINRSPKSNIILEFGLCFRSADGQERWSWELESDDIDWKIGPEDVAQGQLNFHMGQVKGFIPTDPNTATVYDAHRPHRNVRMPTNDNGPGIYLHVRDLVSHRNKRFRIPGSYPPGYFAPPITPPSGTS